VGLGEKFGGEKKGRRMNANEPSAVELLGNVDLMKK